MKTQLKRFSPIILAILAVCLMGVVSVRAQGGARVRVVHAWPGPQNLDIYFEGNLLFPGLPYGGVSGYTPVPAGNQVVRVLPAGVSLGNPPLIEPTFSFADGRDHTLLILPNEIQPLEDDNSLPEPGQARIRIIHASPDAPALDICRAGTGECIFTNLTFRSNTGYLTLEAATYNIDIRQTGTNTVLLNISDLRLADQGVYSAFIVGFFQGSPGLQLLTGIPDTGQPPPLPPTTGAFLSPPALILVMIVGLGLAGGFWLARRRSTRVQHL